MHEVINWLHTIVGTHPGMAYLFYFVVCIGENVLPFIPGDMILVYGGYLVGRDVLGFWPMFIVSFAGHFVGFMFVYWLGRRYGRAGMRLLPWLSKMEPWIDRAEHHVLRYGVILIVVNRFLPGIRSVISISVGLLRMRWWIVAVSAFFSIAIWNSLLLHGGATVGRNWEEVAETLRHYNTITGIILVVMIVAGGIIWRKARKRTLTKDI